MKGMLKKATLALVLVLGLFSVRGGVLAETVNASNASDITNAKSGGTVVLTADITADQPIEINKNLVIDLNGHKITVGSSNTIAVKVTGGNVILRSTGDKTGAIESKVSSGEGVRVSGGSLTVEEKVKISGNYMGIRGTGGNAKLHGGSVYGMYSVYMVDGNFEMTSGMVTCSSNCYSGVWVTAEQKDVKAEISGGSIILGNNSYGVIGYPSTSHSATLDISGGKISVGDNSIGVCGNGTYHGTVFNITGGTIESGDTGVYHPQDGILNISGDARIVGKLTGVEIRSGTLNVSGNATIIGGSPDASGSVGNGNGTTSNNAAIAVAQHTTKKAISVNITGGTMQSTSALFVSNPQNNSASAGKVSVSIADGTTVPRFNGDVKITDTRVATPFISGGLYNNPVNKDYIKTGYTTVNADGQVFRYRVTKEVAEEDLPPAPVPAPMPEEIKDITAQANNDAAKQGVTVKPLEINTETEDMTNYGFTQNEVEKGALIWAEVKPLPAPENTTAGKKIQGALQGDSEVAIWLDISLMKQVVGEKKEPITETKKPVVFSLKLDKKNLMPEGKSSTHQYVVYRYHNGVAERLTTWFDAKTNTLTFETDRFSTYAIVYEALPVLPQTGDNSQLALLLALLGMSAASLLLLMKRRRA